jgi:hypothetical protein
MNKLTTEEKVKIPDFLKVLYNYDKCGVTPGSQL